MSLFKKMSDWFVTAGGPRGNFYAFAVKCSRCGEVIAGRVNVNNDLSVEYEGRSEVFHVRKVLIGSGRCYQQIEVELKFNPERKLLDRRVTGGEFVEA